MRAGKLRERVVVERPATTSTRSGQAKRKWKQVAACRASIDTIRSFQRFKGDQVEGTATHTIEMRYLDGVDHTYRVRALDFKGGKTFDVESVDPDHKGGMLTLQVVEVRT